MAPSNNGLSASKVSTTTFDWKEYVELARSVTTLAGTFSSEARERAGVSRAYYGAFCHARNYAQAILQYKPFNDGRDHKEVREHLRRKNMTPVAIDLDQLHRLRKKCDYWNQLQNTNKIYSSAITLADNIIKSL
jgi:hypothetical protein